MDFLFWGFVVGIGPLLLAAAMIYAVLRQRRLSPGEKQAQHERVAELYDSDSDINKS
ncbi:hypothetical protein [Hoeflea ulvae]|uniref:Uncharacterized protein n=1 Tax=Hoeflea ulvae TaxID=2983764 RepID=A0ABT3YM12_9HYPH|nr:hypothetical protein [Hoeflea ulvae]MCY0096935.1 hypothetical protein [Hoeflea ulvae]